MLKAAFLHDTDSTFPGCAELFGKAILEVSMQHGVYAVYDNLTDFGKTKALIHESDFVIVNNTVKCKYVLQLIDFLVHCGKPYVKWEHDYNFCTKRTAICFVDRKVKGCCDRERFTAYRKLFAHAKLSVFASPKHYELHREIYGEAIQHPFILPPPVDGAHIRLLPKEKNTVCFIGDLRFKKGGNRLIDFANENPHFRIEVYGSNLTGRTLPPNITLKEKRRNTEIHEAVAKAEYLFLQPVWPDPDGRVAAEAFLAGCKTIGNANVGFHSFPFYPTHPEEAREAIRNAPHLFWEKVKEAVHAPEKKVRWKNVLVFKSFGGLGDFLFTIPALHKIAGVSEKVTVCVPNALHGLLKKQLPQYEVQSEDFIKTAHLSDYDKIIDLSNYPSYRGDPHTYKIPFPSYRRIRQHAFRHYLDGVATLHPEIDNACDRFPYLQSSVAPKEIYFTVHPGAGFAAKYWNLWKYGKLIQNLLDLFPHLHCKLILGPNDPKPEELFEIIPERVSIPKGNLEMIADVLAGALFHVGNDSGMTHLAGAFNTPTVTIHGPTGPGTWMSFAEHKELIWGKAGVCNIPCNYDTAINCAHRICLNSVTVERVLKHVLKLLQNILPQQKKFRYIFNPDAQVQPQEDAWIIHSGEKELLIEFSATDEKQWFEMLVKNALQPGYFSESFNALLEVLQENEMLFKVPDLRDSAIQKNKLPKTNMVTKA
ncbi:MAG: hypothetical protein KatS3mg031_1326 [Chitinophagales bacterium]|nr:MAG: hypothetical protein KatS3mg031_1326 [Chitinophagales bacterium]